MNNINNIDQRNLNSDQTDLLLCVTAQKLDDLERAMKFANGLELLALATEHRELLDFYKAEIARYEAINPYQTDHDL